MKCRRCARPSAPGRKRCAECLAEARDHARRVAALETPEERAERLEGLRQYQRAYREAKKERGECQKCARPAYLGYSRCVQHLSARRLSKC